ncbi:MAG: hypothetical protein JO104_06000, partial [Candidatus Eremiobacteraeota bacterium]|nr:hypothetical protein [Candidatus Eremiobacteraeota bacterium]
MAIALVFLALACAPPSASAQQRETWLAISDVHLDLYDRSTGPSAPGVETNATLFESAVAAAKRVAPNPTLVLLPGDFLMHRFAERLRDRLHAPDAAGIETMRWIAGKLGRAFPAARFALALGNNDAPCGDYKSADESSYLTAVAQAWAPLVNRGGASPNFVAAFTRGAYYTVQLPTGRLRLVVVNTLRLSNQYRGNCGRS